MAPISRRKLPFTPSADLEQCKFGLALADAVGVLRGRRIGHLQRSTRRRAFACSLHRTQVDESPHTKSCRLLGEPTRTLDIDCAVARQRIRPALMHHMRAGGAMDHNLDALQGAHPVGMRADIANHARRRRRRTADDTDDRVTAAS
jgi:hypothetical protein